MKPSDFHGPFAQARSDAELQALLQDYLFLERGSGAQQDAFDAAVDLLRDAPEDCWRLIKLAAKMDLSTEQAAFLAAGPVEDLLRQHGEQFIDRLEIAVRREPGMRVLMAGVWPRALPQAIASRVLSLREKLGIEPV